MQQKTFPEPQAYTDEARPQIQLVPVESNQVKAIGYDPETKTLAVTFTRGQGAVYHYPGVPIELFHELLAAESIGRFVRQRVTVLPFRKYRAELPQQPA